LAKSRTLALIAALDARRAFELGNTKAARHDATSIMALARHLGQDPIMICLLVNYVLEDLVVDLIAPYVPELKVSHAEAVAMYNVLPTPATLAEAIEHEKKIMGPSIIRQMREADKRKAGAWREAWNQMLQGSEASDSVKNVGSLGQAEALLDECFSEYDRMAQLVQLPQPEFETQYSEFERRIKEANALGAVLLPSINKLVARERSRTARMQLLLAAIAVVESGPESLANFKDPFGDGPFTYEKLADGFQLGSQFLLEGQPVTVKFGR
jgi:hypothetical protein